MTTILILSCGTRNKLVRFLKKPFIVCRAAEG